MAKQVGADGAVVNRFLEDTSSINSDSLTVTGPGGQTVVTKGMDPVKARQQIAIVRGSAVNNTKAEPVPVETATRPATADTGETVRTSREAAGTTVSEDPYEKARSQLEEVVGRKDERVDRVVEEMKSLGETRTSAFDKLFGPESSLSRFYAPSIQAVEEQILDTEELLDELRTDVQERNEDTGLTQSQFRRIEAKERGDLTDQLDKLVRAQTRLRAGFDQQLQMSQLEFENTVQAAQDGIEALKFELQNTGMEDAEIALITRALEEDISQRAAQASEDRQIAAEIRQEKRDQEKETSAERKEKEQALDDILQSAMDFVLQAGVIPTGNFEKVIEDAKKMFEEGATMSEIQLGVLRAVGDNPAVRSYINTQFGAKKTSGSGKKLTRGDLSTDQELLLSSVEAQVEDLIVNQGQAPSTALNAGKQALEASGNGGLIQFLDTNVKIDSPSDIADYLEANLLRE